MWLEIDSKADALYFRLGEERIVSSEMVTLDLVLDFDEQDQVVGIEYLNVSRHISRESLGNITFKI